MMVCCRSNCVILIPDDQFIICSSPSGPPSPPLEPFDNQSSAPQGCNEIFVYESSVKFGFSGKAKFRIFAQTEKIFGGKFREKSRKNMFVIYNISNAHFIIHPYCLRMSCSWSAHSTQIHSKYLVIHLSDVDTL